MQCAYIRMRGIVLLCAFFKLIAIPSQTWDCVAREVTTNNARVNAEHAPYLAYVYD